MAHVFKLIVKETIIILCQKNCKTGLMQYSADEEAQALVACRCDKYKVYCASSCDFQQCGILTRVDSYEPVQPPFKLRKSK